MSEVLWRSDEIAAAVGGEASADFAVKGISIDTRSLKEGDLFVALKDQRDGHDFLEQAFASGAGGALVSKSCGGPNVRANDTLKALRGLGQAGVNRSKAARIAVTGSVGKTSVKDALAVMLSRFGNVHKSLKSFNNHIGVPITMALMPQSSDYGVFEMGMNHAGELSDLSKLLAPNIAVITTVAAAHLAHFENVDAIARAKAEIMDGLSEGGTLILNGDNDYTPLIRDMAASKNIRVMTFGHDNANDVVIVSTNSHAGGGNVRLRVEHQQIDVTLSVPGEHWFSNAACCLAVAKVLGVDLRKAAMGLRAVQPAAGRGDKHSLSVDGKSITLINESYNANPASMRAAVSAAALSTGRKLAVLGAMGELGADELALHADLAAPLIEAGFARVITVGETMRALRGALPQEMRGAWVANETEAEDALRGEIQDGDIVLIKGSNAVGLGKLTARLIDSHKQD